MENAQNQPKVIADGVVVSLDYKLRVDGEVFEESPEGEPIEFIQGHGHIIPGLERSLYGLEIGDRKEVVVEAEDAYGGMDPEAILDVPRSEFPEDIPLEPGIQIQVQDEEGQDMDATIVSVSDDTVQLDFNHPLAGKDLSFDVTVVGLREATAEELDHGHIHADGLEGEEFADDDGHVH